MFGERAQLDFLDMRRFSEDLKKGYDKENVVFRQQSDIPRPKRTMIM